MESTTTTVEPDLAPGVIVGSGGVLGWWDGAYRPAEDAAAVPLDPGSTFQIVGPTGIAGTATGATAQTGCELVEGHVTLPLDPDPYDGYDPFESNPLAVAAGWDLVPQPVVELPLDSAVYAEVVSEFLASRGLDDPDPVIVQLYRVDFEGDGTDEIVIVADNHGGDFYQLNAYSLVLVRKVVFGEVETAVLHDSIVPAELGPDEIPLSVIARVAALADLDADGVLEIAIDSAYYEGAGTEVWDYVDDDLGFVSVLLTGCGA